MKRIVVGLFVTTILTALPVALRADTSAQSPYNSSVNTGPIPPAPSASQPQAQVAPPPQTPPAQATPSAPPPVQSAPPAYAYGYYGPYGPPPVYVAVPPPYYYYGYAPRRVYAYPPYAAVGGYYGGHGHYGGYGGIPLPGIFLGFRFH